MKSALTGVLLLAVATGIVTPAASADQSTDVASIQDVQARQAEAWNHHDAKAYAALFAEDGEVVNVVGWWWEGRAQIEAKLTAAFAFAFRDSSLTVNDVKVRFLTRDIAIAHVLWSMVGAHMPPGVPEPHRGIEVQVLQRLAGRWLIVSFQNTNSMPDVPFPAGPPPASPPAANNN